MSKPPKKTSPPAKAEKPATEIASPPATASEKPKSLAARGAVHLYSRILGVMRSRDASEASEIQKDFAVYALTGLKPENAAEVLLCSQMVATWEAGLAMLSAAKSSTDFQSLEAQGALAVKLLSVFERQFATLTKARKPPQVVTVEHVHKHLHFEAPQPTGGEIRIEGQAYESAPPAALAPPAAPALLGQDAAGDAMPVPSNQPRPLPAARRSKRDRRPVR
jgi:hypothetical protein